MKHTMLFLLCFFFALIARGQSDDCDGATFLTTNELNCQSLGENIVGSTVGAGTEDGVNRLGCIDGTTVEGVWYRFSAEGTDIEIVNNGGETPHVMLFKNVCPPNITDLIYCGQADLQIETGGGDNLLITGDSYLLWVGFENAPASYDLCITNPASPVNDLCENAQILDSTQLDCPEINNSVLGHTTNASQQGLYFTNLDPLTDLACALDTTQDSGVWYRFIAIGTDIEIYDNFGNNPTILLMSDRQCTEQTMSAVFCEQTPITSDFGQVGNNATVIGEEYLMYVTFQGGESATDTFELCIDNEGRCNNRGTFATSWCQAIPICGLESIDGICYGMIADSLPSEGFPDCANSLDNPNWISFIAGANNLFIEIQVGDCQQGQGIQVGMYEILDTENLGPDQPFCPANSNGLGPLLTGCATISVAQPPGTVITFIGNTEVGKTYALVFDGWGPDLCGIEINVLQGGELVNLDSLVLDPPIWDDSLFPFYADTVCVGSDSVLFRLDETLGACGSQWTLNGQLLQEADPFKRYVDFPNAGTYTICVSIENSISSSNTACVEVIAAEFFPTVTEVDTFLSCEQPLFIDARNYFGFEFIQGIVFRLPNGMQVEMDTLSTLDTGKYVISANDCSDTIIINVGPSASFNVVNSQLDCYHSSLDLIVQGLTNPKYLWNTGDKTPILDSLSFGWYSVTISSDNHSCDYVRSYFVDVPDSCKSTISGFVNLQDTVVCATNAERFPIENQKIEIVPTGIIIPTNAAGLYQVDLPPGIYEVTPVLGPSQIKFCPDMYTDTLTNSGDTLIRNIDVLDTSFCKLEICAASGVARAGMYVSFTVDIKNRSSSSSLAQLNAAFDGPYSLNAIISASVPIVSTSSGIVRWSPVAIAPGETRKIRFSVRLNTSVQNGRLLRNSFFLNECASIKEFNQVVQASYDPNDKTLINTLSRSNQNIFKSDSILDYVIRFQNTGDDTAFFVKVTDQLSEHFNLHSFSPGASSHDYTWRILPDRTVEFTFDPILLPHQSIDDDGSQGFVSFSIRPNEDFMPEDSILNNAAIFFDFNAPVITNTVNTIYKRPQITETIYDAICEGDTFLDILINTDTTFDVVKAFFDFDSVYTYNLEAIDIEVFQVDTNVVAGSVFLGDTIMMDTMFTLSYVDSMNGCEYFIEYTVNVITATSNIDVHDISASPNPFNNDLQFFAHGLIQKIELYDVNGKLMLVQENINSSEVSLSTSSMNSGLYFAIVTMSGRQHHVKVMKL